MGNSTMQVQEIIVYPVKSLRGTRPPPSRSSISNDEPSYTLTPLGLPHDRHFMLQRLSSPRKDGDVENMHVTYYPAMCLFHTSFLPALRPDPHSVQVDYKFKHTYDKPDQILESNEPLIIPLRPDVDQLEKVGVVMHSSPCTGFNMGEEYNAWFSARFGYGVRLLYLGQSRRPILGNMLPDESKDYTGEAPADKGINEHQVTSAAISGSRSSWFASTISMATSILSNSNPSSIIAGEWLFSKPVQPPTISFADVAPYLVVSEKSYHEVQSRFTSLDSSLSSSFSNKTTKDTEGSSSSLAVAKPTSTEEQQDQDPETATAVSITKFRPNIIISGAQEAWEEDFWAELEITNPTANTTASISDPKATAITTATAPVKLTLTQNCSRCASLNVSYSTGHFDTGPAGTLLKSLQRDRRVDRGAKWSPIFGRYGFLRAVGGDIEMEVGVKRIASACESEEADSKTRMQQQQIRIGDVVKVTKRNQERTRFAWPGLSTDN